MNDQQCKYQPKKCNPFLSNEKLLFQEILLYSNKQHCFRNKNINTATCRASIQDDYPERNREK